MKSSAHQPVGPVLKQIRCEQKAAALSAKKAAESQSRKKSKKPVKVASIPKKALENDTTNAKVKIVSDKLESIMFLDGGCDEGRIAKKTVSKIPNVVEGEDTKAGEAATLSNSTQAAKVVTLSESQVKEKAEQLTSKIVQDMQNKMKWSFNCFCGKARVYTAGKCLDGPEVFLKIFRLGEKALRKRRFCFVFTQGEFLDHFGCLPCGVDRYGDDLPLNGLIEGRWWHRTGDYKIWGTYGKPQKD